MFEVYYVSLYSKQEREIFLMNNWNRILNLSIVMHTFLRTAINKFGYINTVKAISISLKSTSASLRTFTPLSTKQIRRIATTIIAADMLVASCVSISLIVHLFCLLPKTKSNIVIGVTVINDKVFSHAWVETNNEKIDFMSEGYDYKVIKKFSLLDRL